jgi:hypothetical protein
LRSLIAPQKDPTGDKCARYADDSFLVLLLAREQMGKAEGHFLWSAETAYRTNRTIVLPGYDQGNMGFLGSAAFEDVYDVQKLPQELKWITAADYIHCVKDVWGAHSQKFWMEIVSDNFGMDRRKTREAVRRFRLHVLGNLPFEGEPWVTPWLNLAGTVDAPLAQLSPAQRIALRAKHRHVLLSYLPVLKDEFTWHNPREDMLHLHPAWHRGAMEFRKKHGGYVALHWRTEKATK